MKKPLIVFLAVVFMALLAPAVVASGGHRHHHNPPPSAPPESPPPTQTTDPVPMATGGGGHSTLEKAGILALEIGAVFCIGKWLFTDGSCADYFKSAPPPRDPDPTRVTPDNTSGPGLRFGTTPLKP
jgi:hypothetical protein